LNVVFGHNFVLVKVVCGGLILIQPRPSRCTQYHQSPESVEAFHASEILVGPVAVIRRLVGVVGAAPLLGGGGGSGLLAGAAAVKTSASASARTLTANAMVRNGI
jgi:hypothetical protein